MKKYKFYIVLILLSIILGIIFFYISDYSRLVKTVYSVMKEEDKEKIINGLVEKVEVDSIKENFRQTLIQFGSKIEKDEYSDEHLKVLLKNFENMVNDDKITYNELEEFTKKVNQDF